MAIRSKNFWILGLNSSLGWPSKSKSNEKLLRSSFFSKVNFVMVLQWFNVKLTDGLAGICSEAILLVPMMPSLLPQYLTKAMLLGALH